METDDDLRREGFSDLKTISREPPACPACVSADEDDRSPPAILTEPGICPRCGPLHLFLVTQSRVKRVVHERRVWAPSAEAAIALVGQGTAWPESYDENVIRTFAGARDARKIDGDQARKFAGFDVGFYDEEE